MIADANANANANADANADANAASSSSSPAVGSKRKHRDEPEALCKRRVPKEFSDLKKIDTRAELGMEFELVDPDDVMEWRAKWFYDMAHTKDASETQNALHDALKKRGLEFIEFRIVFPPEYPRLPPFVYCYYPRLKGPFIFSQGGLCAETLSAEHGWSCASRASSLMVTVRSLLETNKCRLATSPDDYREEKTLLTPFSEEGARADFKAISNIHSDGWHGSKGKS